MCQISPFLLSSQTVCTLARKCIDIVPDYIDADMVQVQVEIYIHDYVDVCLVLYAEGPQFSCSWLRKKGLEALVDFVYFIFKGQTIEITYAKKKSMTKLESDASWLRINSIFQVRKPSSFPKVPHFYSLIANVALLTDLLFIMVLMNMERSIIKGQWLGRHQNTDRMLPNMQ